MRLYWGKKHRAGKETYAMDEKFVRTGMLLGEQALEILRSSRVAVFGVGGVGSCAVEVLARSGVGALDLIDPDRVAESNLNRQLIALHSTLGQYKTDAAKARVLDINPDCRVTVWRTFYLPETKGQFDFSLYNYIVDAIDTVQGKLSLAEEAQKAGVPVISAMGAGNKLDPTAFRVADIYDTSVCPLARAVRTECRRRGIRRLKVVYSRETPLQPGCAGEALPPGKRALPGSVAFVPTVMGMIMAGEVVKDLTNVR